MKKQFATGFSILVVLSLLLTACSTSATTASCAYIVGDGTYDTVIDRIIYPGQSVPVDSGGSYHKVQYVPCNQRNYLINDGSKTNANGTLVGDEHTLIKAKTESGTDILIAVSAYWTLNQSEDAMRAFYAFQLKYKAASDRDIAGDFNSSTEGWNNMLGENFGPAMARAAREGASLTDDSIWQTNDPDQITILKDYMTDNIDDKLRQNVGYSDFDLFCGSGQSQWTDPNAPGTGEFFCAPIRIEIDSVIRNPDQSNASTEGSIDLGTQQRKIAEEKYGVEEAGCWLALQDLVQACKGSGSTCVFNFSGACTSNNGVSPAITLPTSTP